MCVSVLLIFLFLYANMTYVIFIQEHLVRTGSGSVSVIVYGDQDKPALLTYPDLALNRKRLFSSFGFLIHCFYIYSCHCFLLFVDINMNCNEDFTL